MQATSVISRRNLDQLEEDIISLSAHINASEYEFLVLIREFSHVWVVHPWYWGFLSITLNKSILTIMTLRLAFAANPIAPLKRH